MSETKEAAQKVTIDPLVLFQQIESLRTEGVPEETIKAAFAEFMNQVSGNVRKAQPTMRRTPESVPMPTQEEINKLYEERYKGIDTEIADPSVGLILDAIERSNKIRTQIVNPTLTDRVKMLGYRISYLFLSKLLQAIVFVFAKMGVK